MDDNNLELIYGRHMTILGATGTGKTVLAEWIYSQLPRAIIYDIEQCDGWEFTVDDSIVIGDVDLFRYLMHLIHKVKLPKYHIVYQPNDRMVKKQLWNNFNQICDTIFTTGNTALFCDELHQVTEKLNAPEGFERLVKRGRKWGISVYGATQRNQDITNAMVTQSYHFISMMLSDYDMNMYKQWIPDIEMVKNLQDYQFLYRKLSGRNSVIMDKVDNPVNIKNEPLYVSTDDEIRAYIRERLEHRERLPLPDDEPLPETDESYSESDVTDSEIEPEKEN